MSNPTMHQVTLPSGSVYDFEDKAAREAIAAMNGKEWYIVTQASDTPYGVKWMNGGTEITGTLVASADTRSRIYFVPATTADGKDVYAEYVTVVPATDTYQWEKFGTTDINVSSLGALAYKNSATGNFTPQGSVVVNAASGDGTAYTPEGEVQVNAADGTGTDYTPEGGIQVNAADGTGTDYTPEGSVAAPTISKKTAGDTASVTPFGSAGSLPSLSMTVQDGNLTISFDQGSLPSAGSPVTVKTGDAVYEASAPAFTGTKKKLAFSGTKKKLAFSGTQKKLAFNGTQGSVTVS